MFIQIEEYILNFLLSYASEPSIAYIGIFILMTMGSFGLPISEEVVIIAAGLMAYMGSHPEIYPQIAEATHIMTLHTTALVCFLSVFLSDFLVFLIGRFLHNSISKHSFVVKLIPKQKMMKISKWVNRYGYFYPAIFRFIPLLRFPGHLSSGFFKIPYSQFIIVDGLAVLITVPTQVLLISFLGHKIIEHLKVFSIVIGATLIVFIGVFLFRKFSDIKRVFTSQNEEML